jgi:hypothetical protein
MDVVSLFVANAESALVEQPREGGFDHVTPFAQTAPMFGVALGYQRMNAAFAQRSANLVLGIIGPIRKQAVGPFPGSAAGLFDGLDCVHHRHRHLGVVHVGGCVFDRQRSAVAVGQRVSLRAIFPTISGVRPSLAPPKSARTEQLSMTTLDQSISSACPNSSSSAFQIFFQTPAACQSRNRRQQVMPLPQPNSVGRYSQGQPLRRTKRMPVRAARSETRGRPPLGFGGSGGM